MPAVADISRFQESAAEAADLLRLLANENRLLILCQLAMEKEVAVGGLADRVGLSQSALSQHLARMREEGLLATRRDGTTVFYRIADAKVRRVLTLLKNLYCP
jgi:DNA-binding transcriptional ArsR family regulator